MVIGTDLQLCPHNCFAADKNVRAPPGCSSTTFDGKADDLSRFAFSEDFEWSAADLAIGREPLAGDTGVEDQFESLPAERALNGSRAFHVV
jgi:hypothetical protein